MRIPTYVSCCGTKVTHTTVVTSESFQLSLSGLWTHLCDCICVTLRTAGLQPITQCLQSDYQKTGCMNNRVQVTWRDVTWRDVAHSLNAFALPETCVILNYVHHVGPQRSTAPRARLKRLIQCNELNTPCVLSGHLECTQW